MVLCVHVHVHVHVTCSLVAHNHRQILWLVAFVATVLLGADLGLLVGVVSAVVMIVSKTAL